MNLRALESQPTNGSVESYQGTVVKDPSTGALLVNVKGSVIPARWSDPLVVSAGDAVTVAITAGPTGLGDAVVTDRLTLQPRPATGTVKIVPASSSTITVTGTDNVDYIAFFVGSYTPTVNENVILAWNAATPTVTGKIGTSAAPAPPPSPVAPPPGPPATGTSTYQAQDSATWVPGLGLWDAWARQGGRVYQGSSGGYATYGAFFYAGSPGELAGRAVSRVQLTLGTRLGVGSLNSPITLHVYTHTSANRPGGDVSRVTGPFDIVIQPGAGQQTFDIFNAAAGIGLGGFATDLQNGGGIAIAGDPYAGCNGRIQEPASGLLTMDWSR